MTDSFDNVEYTEEQLAEIEKEIEGLNDESEPQDAEPEQTEEEFEKEIENLTDEQKKGIRGLKARFKERIEESQAKVASKFLNRWSELSGYPGDYDRIDYDNPYIQLEYRMCDAKTLMKLSSPKLREATLATFPPDVAEVFWTVGPGNSKKYCDTILTPKMIKRGAKSQLKAHNKAVKKSALIHRLSDDERAKYKAIKEGQKEINKARARERREAKRKNKR